MSNHYHFLVETIDGNLSRGMRHLNGVYTQHFNHRHQEVGHLFQGRYKAILVQKEAYLLELSRYVVLNPIRAGMVKTLEDWAWSSYPATMGLATAPLWLDTDWLLSQFGKQRKRARVKYRQFVLQGKGLSSPLMSTRHQLILGDEQFINKHRPDKETEQLREVSKSQRRAVVRPLTEYEKESDTRNQAMARAYLTGAYTMKEIADYFGVHYMTVSRAVRQNEVG